MATKAQQIQRQLFYDISRILEAQGLKSDYLQELLNIKKSTLYRRINAETLLNLSELTLLVERFDLKLLQYFHNDQGSIWMDMPSLEKKITTEKEYVSGLLSRISLASKLEGIQMYYITSEIPILNYFRYKELAFFKLYIYGKTVWELPHLEEQQFKLKVEEEDFYEDAFSKINNLYTTIPSTEIWSTHLVDNTLNQIKYYAQGGMFQNKADVTLILTQLSQLMQDLQAAAKIGYKTFPDGRIGGAFNLYHNEITHTNNVVLLDSYSRKFAFSTYDNPNYMETNNVEFWNYSFKWFLNLQKRSHAVSQQSERNRLMLFNLCQSKINRLGMLIEVMDI